MTHGLIGLAVVMVVMVAIARRLLRSDQSDAEWEVTSEWEERW